MFNKDGNHGYFSLLHNLTSNIEGTIVELGNREGLGILSIYDALSENSELYTLDIVDDVRFINDKIKNDPRVHILNDFNSLDSGRVQNTFEKNSISMIFLDTIHTYEQVFSEFLVWKQYMKDDCVMLIDDIRDYMPGRTKWRFHTELDYTYKYDVTEWAHNDTGFGVYLK
jgi:predicted O-methyltransferase YrrM